MNNIVHFLLVLLAPSSAGIMMSPIWRGTRNRGIIATVAVATVIVAGTAIIPKIPISDGGGSPPVGGGITAANVWIDSNGGSCTFSASPVAYNDATACSMSGSVQYFASGRTIGIKGGDYGQTPWNIPRVAGLDNLSPGCDPTGEWGTATATNCVHIAPYLGDNIVDVGAIEVASSGVWFDFERTSATWPTTSPTYNFEVKGGLVVLSSNDNPGFNVDHVTVNGINAVSLGSAGADHVLIENSDGGAWHVTGESGVNCVVHDEFGVAVDADENKIAARDGFNATNVVMARDYFHDVNRIGGSCHGGGFFMVNGDGVTFHQDLWSSNIVYDMQVQDFNSQGYPTNVTIENSWFGCTVEEEADAGGSFHQCSNTHQIQFDSASPAANWLIRFNSFGSGTASSCQVPNCSYSNVRFVGNTGSRPATGSQDPCGGPSGVSFDHNAWVSGTCGATDINLGTTIASLFVNTASGAENFHLSGAPGSTGADNFVPSSTDANLSTDIDAQTRPIGAQRDAGSDER